MHPQSMLTLILDEHARRHRQAAAESMARLGRRSEFDGAGAGTRPGRPTPRPPLGPLARVAARATWFRFA